MAPALPEAARPMFGVVVHMLAELDKRIATLDREIAKRAREERRQSLMWGIQLRRNEIWLVDFWRLRPPADSCPQFCIRHFRAAATTPSCQELR